MTNAKLSVTAWASDPPSDVGKPSLHSFEKQTLQHSLSPSSSGPSQPELSPLSSSFKISVRISAIFLLNWFYCTPETYLLIPWMFQAFTLNFVSIAIGSTFFHVTDNTTMTLFFSYFVVTIKSPTVSNHFLRIFGFWLALVATITLILIKLTQSETKTEHRNNTSLKYLAVKYIINIISLDPYSMIHTMVHEP